ncbi:hypothetical protein FIV34_11925 [Luteibacter pinisoli]|uniref:Ankyrin repeat domain-containing protein n=1 Tax=Luteibacter pinisoli TaxID=2589080 RepID=A0A4Y5Z6K4_9GAMM|nr:hypothetical protein [Luteibacter pinisoli]QDE39868.1 hypothetical protein FIV34_11925 [Luteibacter pinisoli]
MTIRRRLRRNTHVKRPGMLSEPCRSAIASGNVRGASEHLADGLDGAMEGYFWDDPREARLKRLTLLSLATLVDSRRDQLLMLPLVLSRTGNVNQVDSAGRTLLHFAKTRRVARYLLEAGVPVEEGMKEPLLAALSAEPGIASFDDDIPLAFVDLHGHEPSILACVRAISAERSPMPGSAVFHESHWHHVMPGDTCDALRALPKIHQQRAEASIRITADLVALGNEGRLAEAGRLLMDNLGVFGAQDRPAPRVEMSLRTALRDALEQGRSDHVSRLVALGADISTLCYAYDIPEEGGAWRFARISALGLAALIACEAFGGEDDQSLGKRSLAALAHMMEAGPAGGMHAEGGGTLMHLAHHPDVARWLLEHGAPHDVPDLAGRLPADVLPSSIGRLIEAHHLSKTLATAKGEVRRSGRL